jgi:hypothetical protein
MEVLWDGFMGVPSSFVTIQRTYVFVLKYILSLYNSTSNKIKPQPRQSNVKLIYFYLDSKVPRLQFAVGLCMSPVNSNGNPTPGLQKMSFNSSANDRCYLPLDVLTMVMIQLSPTPSLSIHGFSKTSPIPSSQVTSYSISPPQLSLYRMTRCHPFSS